MRTQALLVLASGIVQAASAAGAESPNPSPNGSPPAVQEQQNKACPPNVGPNAPTVGSGQSNQNLSDQLNQSGGIICPPAGTDPEMAVPPKDGGRTPVIPPPGAPGGNPNIQPK